MDLIDRQAAIDAITDACKAVMDKCECHYDKEVDDLVYDDIREVDAVLRCNKEIGSSIRQLPSAQPEIIRCKDCKWKEGSECVRFADIRPFPTDFCSRAERKEDGEID